MKYLLIKHDLLLKIMRVSFLQACLFIMILGVSYATTSPGQSLLDKRITINIINKPLTNVLYEIETATGVKFMYSPKIVRSDRRVTVNASNQLLAEVFQSIFSQLSLNYKINGEHVIINSSTINNSSIKQHGSPIFMGNQMERIISGRVHDESGEGLPGVSVVLKGSMIGTITESDGTYSLKLENNIPTTLIFLFVGFVSQEIEVGTQSELNIALQVENKALQEIVVVGVVLH